MSSPEKFEPLVFNTHSLGRRAHFENYDGTQTFENGESELDDIREEIATHFGVPIDDGHIFIIDNSLIDKKRSHRAFCVVVRRKPGEEERAWYIDGRTAHVTMLNRLYNYYEVPDDEFNEKHLGFLDLNGFDDVEDMRKESEKRGTQIRWFIRDTINSPAS